MTGLPNGKGPPPCPIGVDGDWFWKPASKSNEQSSDDDNNVSFKSESKQYSLAFKEMVNENKNGVVMNKLLAWMDVQRDMLPPDTWKAHLKSLYTEDEILEAKVALFDAVGGDSSRIGAFKKHHIKQKHLDDLIEAVEKLWNEDEMPLVVVTSRMVKTLRNYSLVDSNKVNLADAMNKMKELENTVKACLKENADQMKNLSDLVNKRQNTNVSAVPQPTTGSRVSVLISENEKRENGGITPPSKKRKTADNFVTPLSSPNSVSGIFPLSRQNNSQQLTVPENTTAWNTVASKPPNRQTGVQSQQVGPNFDSQTPKPQRGAWKKSLNILHGTADSSNTLAADVSLVAYGVAKDATAEGLKAFLEARGIKIVECVNLTTFEFARTHSYKVTIRASEYEKATNPAVWPYWVGVRLFKQFRNKDNDQQSSWNNQVKNANPVNAAPAPTQMQNQVSRQQSPCIETSNMFALLASGGPQCSANEH